MMLTQTLIQIQIHTQILKNGDDRVFIYLNLVLNLRNSIAPIVF